ncbi:MAG: hypothetical protein V1750_00745 [Acidobacteriota bacterium]
MRYGLIRRCRQRAAVIAMLLVCVSASVPRLHSHALSRSRAVPPGSIASDSHGAAALPGPGKSADVQHCPLCAAGPSPLAALGVTIAQAPSLQTGRAEPFVSQVSTGAAASRRHARAPPTRIAA